MARAIAIGAAIAPPLPALADDGYPPSKYDIGGDTVAEVVQNLRDIYGTDAPPLISVPYGRAKAECDHISLERYGTPYPEGNDGSFLVGCLIRQHGFVAADHRLQRRRSGRPGLGRAPAPSRNRPPVGLAGDHPDESHAPQDQPEGLGGKSPGDVEGV